MNLEQREAERGQELREEGNRLIGNINEEFSRVKGAIGQLVADAKEQFDGHSGCSGVPQTTRGTTATENGLADLMGGDEDREGTDQREDQLKFGSRWSTIHRRRRERAVPARKACDSRRIRWAT